MMADSLAKHTHAQVHDHQNNRSVTGQRKPSGGARKEEGPRNRVDGSKPAKRRTIKHRVSPEQRDSRGDRGGGGGGGGATPTISTGAPNRRRERDVAGKNHTTISDNCISTKKSGSNTPPMAPSEEKNAQQPSSGNPRTTTSLAIGVLRGTRRRKTEPLHETDSTTGCTTTRPRPFVRQRPKSAGAAAAVAAPPMSSASTLNQRRKNGQGRPQQCVFLPSETPAAPGGTFIAFEDQQRNKIVTGKNNRRSNSSGERVIPACWGAEKKPPGRRPPPLGKTNAPTNSAKKLEQHGWWSGNGRCKGEGSWYGTWNGSCSCEDLALGLIDKDMERATRELFHQQTGDDTSGAAPEPCPARTVCRRRSGEKKRPSSRPITGTSARLVVTPDPSRGDETKGSPPYEGVVIGDHRHHSSTPALLTKSAPTGSSTNNNENKTPTTNRKKGITFASQQTRGGGGGQGRRKEWNDSTRVDDVPPDALLCKHPGWDVAAGGGREEVGVRARQRGGFFYGGSTARTITTRGSSSAAARDT